MWPSGHPPQPSASARSGFQRGAPDVSEPRPASQGAAAPPPVRVGVAPSLLLDANGSARNRICGLPRHGQPTAPNDVDATAMVEAIRRAARRNGHGPLSKAAHGPASQSTNGRDCAPLRPSRPRRETTRQRRPTARLAVGGLPSRLLAARSLENALKRTRRSQFSLASSTRQLREKQIGRAHV